MARLSSRIEDREGRYKVILVDYRHQGDGGPETTARVGQSGSRRDPG
jgi:hypothetical protein